MHVCISDTKFPPWNRQYHLVCAGYTPLFQYLQASIPDYASGALSPGIASDELLVLRQDLDVVCLLDPNRRGLQDDSQRDRSEEEENRYTAENKMYLDLLSAGLFSFAHCLWRNPRIKGQPAGAGEASPFKEPTNSFLLENKSQRVGQSTWTVVSLGFGQSAQKGRHAMIQSSRKTAYWKAGCS
jgi:hypothetical protein